MLSELPPLPGCPSAAPLGAALARGFAQPAEQALPAEFLVLLARLDRAKRTPR